MVPDKIENGNFEDGKWSGIVGKIINQVTYD